MEAQDLQFEHDADEEELDPVVSAERWALALKFMRENPIEDIAPDFA